MWTMELVTYICLSVVHIVFFATESFNFISFHALSYSSTKCVQCIHLVFFFFLMGGKMCVHTVQLYLVAFHMGLMCEHAQFPKRMWTVDTPNLHILMEFPKHAIFQHQTNYNYRVGYFANLTLSFSSS